MFYIEAYYPDGTQILGNGDGQMALRSLNSHVYTNLLLRKSKRVGEYRIVRSDNYGPTTVIRRILFNQDGTTRIINEKIEKTLKEQTV